MIHVRPTREVRGLRLPPEHPAVVFLMGLAKGSRPTQAAALRNAAKFWGSTPRDFDWCGLTMIQVAGLRSWLAETYAPATANRHLCAVRGVIREGARMDLIPRDRALALCDLPPVRGRREPKGRALEPREVAELMAAASRAGTVAALRSSVAVGLCYGCGLRRAEAASIEVTDGATWHEVLVKGKGNAERIVPVPARAQRAILEWLRVRGTTPGPLLCRIFEGRVKPAEGVQPSNLYNWFHDLAELAGVPPFSPHDLRRTFAGDLLDCGVDLRTVQALLGHADPATTANYDRRSARVRVAAVAKLDDLPWSKTSADDEAPAAAE